MRNFMESGRILYGGDYNPEQWLDCPDILAEDVERFKEAHVNVVSMGIFSWAALEPEEGIFDFSWLEERINTLYDNGIYTLLATPSGSRPRWLADAYPEVLRVDDKGVRDRYGMRHNHCYTSPKYREKVRIIDMELAKRFGNHPGVIGWHISNEFGGECHCPLCQEAFRGWIKEKYQTVENMNKRWMTAFWSHTYQSFDQVESPSPKGENQIHGLNLDWKRFVTERTVDFARWEIESLRLAGSDKPATTNMMYDYPGLNYYKFADLLDFICWDNYPMWHKRDDVLTAMDAGFQHDLMRSIKDQPFYLMESCPSATNWQDVGKLKTPGLLEAAGMHAVAHGADGVEYFQLRQSRGGCEKFHGALIDHYGGNDTRVFREAAKTGAVLEKISEVQGSRTKAPVAVLHDQESRWAMEDAMGMRNDDKHYKEARMKNYEGFCRNYVNVDIVDMECSAERLARYQIVAAPMQYLFREGIQEKLRGFVEQGGTLVLSYWSGIVDDTDLCFLGGTPGGLMDVMGLRSEEIDALFDGETNEAVPVPENALGLDRTYSCGYYSDLVKLNGAEALMTYGNHFYAGMPAVTAHAFGKGKAYYVCAEMEQAFYNDFYGKLLEEAGVPSILPSVEKGSDLLITSRESEKAVYIFIQNFSTEEKKLELPEDLELLSGADREKIPAYSTVVLKKEK